MEEKKFDINSFIGFVLLGAIMIWYFYMNQPTPEQLEQQRVEQVQDSLWHRSDPHSPTVGLRWAIPPRRRGPRPASTRVPVTRPAHRVT